MPVHPPFDVKIPFSMATVADELLLLAVELGATVEVVYFHFAVVAVAVAVADSS